MTSVHEDKRRRRRTSSQSHSSRSHRRRKDHEAGSTSRSIPLDKPTTVEDLRQARITHLKASSPEEPEKMKYEYTRTVVVDKTTGAPQTPTKKRRSSLSSKPATPKGEKRTRKPRTQEVEVNQRREEGFVYCSTVEDQGLDSSDNDQTDDTITKKSRSKSKTEKPITTRRHTVPKPEKRPHISQCESTPPTASLSQLQRCATISPVSGRPLNKSSVHTEKASSEVGSTVLTTRKRSASVLGRMFSTKSSPTPSTETKVSCLTCGDDVVRSRTAKLPCTHRMCHSCLKRIFRLSIHDPAHMPPRCCTDQHIDVKHVDKLFGDDFKKQYNRKFKEYNSKNRIYCPKKGCGQWIQPKHMTLDRGRKVGKCPTCKTYVCATCNQKMHKSRDCPKDPAMKQFADMAKQSGWQKCYNCSATVELKEGCNHMTCRCTAEFCMVCGLKWKSCDCPWFNYNQIDVNGDPIRYQQEMDRRRDQEQRDAELARRMEALDIDGEVRHMFGFGNAAGQHLNQNLFQQAREALTANYHVADQAARGFLNDLFTGREDLVIDPVPMPADRDGQLQRSTTRRRQATTDPAEAPTLTTAGIPVVRRHTHRRRRTTQNALDNHPQTDDAEQDQARRIREWAAGGAPQ